METPENLSNRLKKINIIRDIKNLYHDGEISRQVYIIIREIEKEIASYNTFDNEVPPEDIFKLLVKNYENMEKPDVLTLKKYIRGFQLNRLV